MKDQYTAADMASAAAQGFRDGMKHAADIFDKVRIGEGCAENNAAMYCQVEILKELTGDDE